MLLHRLLLNVMDQLTQNELRWDQIIRLIFDDLDAQATNLFEEQLAVVCVIQLDVWPAFLVALQPGLFQVLGSKELRRFKDDSCFVLEVPLGTFVSDQALNILCLTLFKNLYAMETRIKD